MGAYRVFALDDDGTVVRARLVEAGSDDDATKIASDLRWSRWQVWTGTRLVAESSGAIGGLVNRMLPAFSRRITRRIRCRSARVPIDRCALFSIRHSLRSCIVGLLRLRRPFRLGPIGVAGINPLATI